MPEYTKHPESAIREFCLEPDNENLVILASQYLSDFAAEVLYLRDRLETVERERFTAENHRIGLMTILGVQSGSFSDAVEVVNGNIDRLNSFESLLWRFRDYYEENRNGSPNAMYSFFDGFLREINLAAMKQAPPVERPSENWIIKFEDPDKDDLTFTGAGAEEAARKSFRSAGDNWSCRQRSQLLQKMQQFNLSRAVRAQALSIVLGAPLAPPVGRRNDMTDADRVTILRLLGESATIRNQLAQSVSYLTGIERERNRLIREGGALTLELKTLNGLDRTRDVQERINRNRNRDTVCELELNRLDREESKTRSLALTWNTRLEECDRERETLETAIAAIQEPK